MGGIWRAVKDRGFHITTVFDVNRAAATSLARELGCTASPTLGDVSAGADVVFTIVTDDLAMREIFTGADNLLANARGKLFVNCATVSPKIHVEVERLAEGAGASSLEACMASRITRRPAKARSTDVRWARRKLPARRTDSEGLARHFVTSENLARLRR